MQAGRLSSDTGERKYKAFLTITGAPFVLMYCVCLPASGGVLAVLEIRGRKSLIAARRTEMGRGCREV